MFGIGSVVCAVAPDMAVLLVGRTLQGAAGGLLAGLGYALINAALPPFAVDAEPRHWCRRCGASRR